MAWPCGVVLAKADEADGDMPDWQRELVAKAKEVLRPADWLALPDKFEIHEWEIMDRFGQSLAGAAERREIGDAIRGNGAFRMFKSTIRRLGMEDAWFAFKQRTLEEMARDWLNQHGLPIDETPPDKRVKYIAFAATEAGPAAPSPLPAWDLPAGRA